jgi:predicted transcriptional regulator of viral defense system
MISNLRSLSANEAKVLLTLIEEGRDVVDTHDVIALLEVEAKARKVIYSLTRKGWLVRLGNGRYIVVPPERGPENYGENNALGLAVAALDPSYIGWWSAASFHGLTTQRPTTITVATTKLAAPRIIEGTPVKFIKITSRKFFGFHVFTVYGRETRIASVEKTIVDCIDRPKLCGGFAELTRIVYGAKRMVNSANVVEAAVQMRSVSLLQRLGFLADLVGWKITSDSLDELHRRIPSSARSVVGDQRKLDSHIGYVSDWGLFVNISKQRLLADVPRES